MISRASIPLNLGYLAAFVALNFLASGAHETIHHVVARGTCGAWGTMTFWQFHLAEGCANPRMALLATLAGPMLTYALMWLGMLLVLRGAALAGVTLILANLPLARLVTVLMRGGDEMVLTRALIGEEGWPLLLFATLVLLVPPLVVAYRAIANRWRPLVFAAFLVLPLFWSVLVKRIALGAALERLPQSVAGIPLLALTAYAAAAVLLVLLRHRLTGVRGGVPAV
jgi:hypothetical protein